MNSYELAARLATFSELEAEQQARFVAIYDCATDKALLRMISEAGKHATKAAEWARRATRLAVALARQQELLLDSQRQPLVEALTDSLSSRGITVEPNAIVPFPRRATAVSEPTTTLEAQ